MEKNAWIILTREPIAGETKTRLMPYFYPEQCAKLHICMLKDLEKTSSKVKGKLFICYTPKADTLSEIFKEKAIYFPQKGITLGDRMYQAIKHVSELGYDRIVLIGSDIPEIKAEDINQAFKKLENSDVVFGETDDGGYYLVGMKKPQKEVFSIKSYSHENVLKDTLNELRKSKLLISYVSKRPDLDTPEDLSAYRQRMRGRRELQQTETGKYLMEEARISIIVPIYNEEKTIDAMLSQLRPLLKECEIILVDGGSTDHTLEKITPEFVIFHSEKGRANQMNLGAKESHGDILFFLHCDSQLPDRPLDEIHNVMKNHSAGCFGVAFHSQNALMWICRVRSNHRAKRHKLMFGDQGIFLERELFFEAGLFPSIPIMEDYQLSLTLKARREKIGITRKRIYTSDRRFHKNTIQSFQVMWKMNRIRKMYRDGVDIEVISSMYRDVR